MAQKDSYDNRRKAEKARASFRGAVLATLGSILAFGAGANASTAKTGDAAFSKPDASAKSVPIHSNATGQDSGALRQLMDSSGEKPVYRRRILSWQELVYLRTMPNSGATGKCGKSIYDPKPEDESPKRRRWAARAAALRNS